MDINKTVEMIQTGNNKVVVLHLVILDRLMIIHTAVGKVRQLEYFLSLLNYIVYSWCVPFDSMIHSRYIAIVRHTFYILFV